MHEPFCYRRHTGSMHTLGDEFGALASLRDGASVHRAGGIERLREKVSRRGAFVLPTEPAMKIAIAGLQQLQEALRAA